ncbi:hypothetical protein DL93DRAFT_2078063 [Clavulina sp. PMI_390]|nr:hypothetical protein DL93DRAFT_2078063 [Clavulina sp. PMI_390]
MSRVQIPRLLSPAINDDPTTADSADETTTSPLEASTVQCGPSKPLGFRVTSPLNSPSSTWKSMQLNIYQKKYWDTMRIRKTMHHGQPSMKFFGTILENHPITELVTARLTGDGDIFVLGFVSEVRFVHLELGVVVSVPIEFGSTIFEERRVGVPLAGDVFYYDGKKGILFASTFSRRDEVLIYFLPLDPFYGSAGNSSGDVQLFAKVNLPVGHIVQQLMFSGRFLVIGSTPDLARPWWSYRVFDMETRRTYRVMEEDNRAFAVDVFDDKFFIALHPTNKVTLYTLPPSWTLPPMDTPSDSVLELIPLPHSTSDPPEFPAHTTHKLFVPGVYFNSASDTLPAGLAYFTVYLAEGPSRWDALGTQGSGLWWREDLPRAKAQFQTDYPHLKTQSHKRFPLPHFLSRRPPDVTNHFRGVGHVESGPTSILICAEPAGKVDAPLILAHLRFEQGSSSPVGVDQKPLLLRKKNKRGKEVVERPNCGEADHFFNFEWNEDAGRVILLTSDGQTFRLDLYEF